ncbi:uncharacterized protein PFL1_06157 [Pseudozyma flocculosa PF-1]|uniref:Zn(2)-C6 fungal-type domain-containing protein n=1 Tax=Pseudozyma flocculosa PF-1 TaxID=1277687 RepID=A0A061H141_9BASI|nr:uncharacterized protein PFL1_06157 [Pseudozyma flocculosa PF-1]EPQ26222.1 hypothetical protein PFL1_06157 [Pseudozyma flocculosa PF-1]
MPKYTDSAHDTSPPAAPSAASTTAAAGASTPAPAARSRRPELRSRRGCLTCKQRRKKCDEDFKTRANGAVACTRCSERKLECVPPNSAAAANSSGGSSNIAGRIGAPNGGGGGDDLTSASSIRPAVASSSRAAPPQGSTLLGAQQHQHQQHQARSPLSQQSYPSPSPHQQPPQQQQQQQPQTPYAHQQHPSLHHVAWNLGSLGNGAAAYSAHFPFLGVTNQPQLFGAPQNNGGYGSLPRTSARFNQGSAATPPWQGGFQDAGMGQAPGQMSLAGQQLGAMQSADFSAAAAAGALPQNGNPSAMAAQFIPSVGANDLDNMMLDDFVQELMSLADPASGADGGPYFGTATNSSPATRRNASSTPGHPPAPGSVAASSIASADAPMPDHNGVAATHGAGSSRSDPTSSSLAGARAKDGTGERSRFTSLEAGKAQSRYSKFLDSNAMEPLLKKYSPIYERFWYSTLMLSEVDKRKAIIDHLMGVVHSHKTCQASTVAVCLAYHDLVQRIRQEEKAAAQRKLAQESSSEDALKSFGIGAGPTFSTLASHGLGDKDESKDKLHANTPALSLQLLQMFPENLRHHKRPMGGSRSRKDGEGGQGDGVGEKHGGNGGDDDDDDDGSDGDRDSETDESADSLGGSEPDVARDGESGSRTAAVADATRTSTDAPAGGRPDMPSSRARQKSESGGSSSAAAVGAGKLGGSSGNGGGGSAHRARFASSTMAAIRSPEVWFELALDAMRREVSDLSIEQQLCITINLRWALICFGGAVKAREFMDEIGDVIDRSGYDLNTLIAGERAGTLASTMLQTAVISDVLDAACRRGRRPRTRLNRSAGMVRQPPPKQHQPPPPFFSKISPVTYELLGCTLEVSNLGADMVEGKVTDPAEIARKSSDLEDKIARCAPWCDPNVSGKMRIKLFALQEIWRQTTLIHLFQTVHRHGPLSAKLQGALEEIIGLATMLSRTTRRTGGGGNNNNGGGGRSGGGGGGRGGGTVVGFADRDDGSRQDFWMEMASWEMCMVWFLASSVAVTREQRKFCLQKLEGLGMEKANLDNIDVIRSLWRQADETGHTCDWRDFVEESGMAITFIF